MSAGRALAALASGAVRRPLLVVLVALSLGAVAAGLASGLAPSAEVGTFVDRSSPTYRETEAFYRRFGTEPVEILVKGNLQRLLLSEDLQRLLGLEGCLAGRVSGAALTAEGGANGPCAQLAKMRAAKVVVGPGTFINEAALEIDRGLIAREREARRRAATAQRVVTKRALARGLSRAQANTLGRQAKEVDMRTFEAEVATLAVRYGISSAPSLSDPEFVSTLVFDDAARVPGTPKQRFAYLFPSREAALISVRLRAGLSQRDREGAIAEIRKAVAMRQWRLRYGESYLITGEPTILNELSRSISHSLLLLLVAAMVVMALVLGLVFRGRPRLLPLGVALLSSALVFGGLAAINASLSVGEVAVLPVLIGLAVDYAVQLQSRMQEQIESGLDVKGAAVAAARLGGPPILAAAAASGAAMLVLQLSPVPTVRAFAVLLVIGLAVALLCTVTVGSAAIVLLRDGTRGVMGIRDVAVMEGDVARTRDAMGLEDAARTEDASGGGVPLGSFGLLRASWRGAEDLIRENALTRAVSIAALQRVPRRPRLALAIGVACAALGWGLASLTPVQTDITKLVPQSMTSLRNLATLERLSGVGGELDLLLRGHDLTSPAAIEWMRSFQSRMLSRFGYSEARGCGRAPLCPALSLPSLLSGGGRGSSSGSGGEGAGGAGESSRAHRLSAGEIRSFLAAVPSYFSQEVISADRQAATLAFGLKLMPLARQQSMIEAMRSSLHPPAGVHATLVGLPVLAAAADAQVASTGRRTLQMLLSLLAVTLVLLLAFEGDLQRALIPLVPVALASGWSALMLLLLQVPLNPMSATLGALVISVSTEFSVLISERFREELAGSRSEGEAGAQRALRVAYRRTGAAVAASAATAIAGFGVLMLSDIAMLRDFGFVTLIDLTVSLLGVLLVLPATLTLVYGRDRRPAGAASRMPLRRRSGARGGASA